MGMHAIPSPPRPVRAVLRVLWPALGVVATGLLLPVIVAGAFHALIDRRARLFRVAVLGLLLVWTDIRMLLGCWAISSRSTPESPTWLDEHEKLFAAILDEMMYHAKRWVGFEVRLSEPMRLGRDDRPLIALGRHAGPGDSLALAWLLAHAVERLPRIVLASALRWDAALDTMLTRLHANFVPGKGSSAEDRIQGVAAIAGSLTPRDVMLIFPEGENWTPMRQSTLIDRLGKRGDDLRAWFASTLRNVLPPRAKGVVTALAASPEADVMVIAHAGFGELHSPRAIWDAIPFTGRPFLVKTWTYAAEELPTSRTKSPSGWTRTGPRSTNGSHGCAKSGWPASPVTSADTLRGRHPVPAHLE